jgi:hypothetical protein
VGWASTGASYDYIPELKDVETKPDLAFWGTVPTASNLPSLIILLFFLVIQTFILYHQMFTHTGFQDKYSNQMDQGNFYHNRFLKLECTASFQLTAEVQTPSAEQAHGCKIHI